MFFSKKSKGAAANTAKSDSAKSDSGASNGSGGPAVTHSAPVGATSAALASAGAAALAATQPPPPITAPARPVTPAATAPTEPTPRHPAAPSPEGAREITLSPEEIRIKRQNARRGATSYGTIVSVLARSRPYQAMPLAELRYLALPAMITGQFMAADGLIDLNRLDGPFGPVAIVTWAYVSPEIDHKLLSEPDAPFRLFAPEYKSGDIPWIIEAAGRKPVVDKMIAQLLETEFKGKSVKIRQRGIDGRVSCGVFNTSQSAAA